MDQEPSTNELSRKKVGVKKSTAMAKKNDKTKDSAEIEAKKEAKRKDAASLKDKLSSLKVELVMPAGNNGKLFGAVTNQTVADYLLSQGYEIERKKIEIPGLTIKNTGKYSAIIHLYESAIAEIEINVVAQNSEKPSDEKSKKSSPKPETTTEAENTSDASVTE